MCRYQNKPDRLDMVRHGSRCFPKSSRIRKRLFWTDFKPVVATCRICRLDGGVAHLSLGVRCAVGWGGAYNIRIHSLNSFVELVHLLAALVFAIPFDATVATLQSFENTKSKRLARKQPRSHNNWDDPRNFPVSLCRSLQTAHMDRL